MTKTAAEIIAWILDAGLQGLPQSDLVAGYCDSLVEAGLPLWRASFGADTLHPLINAQGHRWLAGEGVREDFYVRASTPEAEEGWRLSPWYRMIENKEKELRRRLAFNEGTNEFAAACGVGGARRDRLLGADRLVR